MAQPDTDGKRERQLTEKGMEQFQDRVDSHRRILDRTWTDLEGLLVRAKGVSDIGILTELEHEIQKVYESYKHENQVLSEFLASSRTIESKSLLKKLEIQYVSNENQIKYVLDEVKKRIQEQSDNKSVAGSNSSSVSRAKLEAAKARLAISRRELALKQRQAKIKEEKLVTIAKVERQEEELMAELSVLEDEKLVNEAMAEQEEFFEMDSEPPRPRPSMGASDLGLEFSKFLVKRDLLTTRLYKFGDNPSEYRVWKNTFKNVMSDLSVSSEEECDLLIKYLGNQSSAQAINLRAANINSPKTCISKIWQRLDERYGAPELVCKHLNDKLGKIGKISAKDYDKLYNLCDVIAEIECVKCDPQYTTSLALYDSPVGVNPIIAKLPIHIQNKWTDRARKYKVSHSVSFPPFTFLLTFLKEMCDLYNDPSLKVDFTTNHASSGKESYSRNTVFAKKTEVQQSNCPIHKTDSHNLATCRNFAKLSIEDRRKMIKDSKLCYKCCRPDHMVKNCKEDVKCDKCNSTKHITVMHMEKPNIDSNKPSSESNVNCKCVQVCDKLAIRNFKSCAKILKSFVYHETLPYNKLPVYVVIDEQSNKSLATSEFFNKFSDVLGVKTVTYTLNSCGGQIVTTGRTSDGFIIESLDGVKHNLPILTECTIIPGNREEIPTPEVASQFPHLQEVAKRIPRLDDGVEIMLLLGRDILEVHHVKEQVIGSVGPFAQRLSLGWALIGSTCIDQYHCPSDSLTVMKTYIGKNGRPTIFPRCENDINLKIDNYPSDIDSRLFARYKDDNKIGTSVEDRQFIQLMDKECRLGENNKWEAPLPFKVDKEIAPPNNREHTLKRARILDSTIQKNETKKQHFVSFMEKVLSSGAAEVAPQLKGHVWYLPLFGVYHPKKPDKIRGVFDSSAVFQGTSLNSLLMSGPKLTNNLLHILLRFRKNQYAMTADIEQMFYSFLVREEHRDFLRFFWYKDNNPSLPLIEYRMTAHVFGNSCSPAVATYALRKTVVDAEDDVKNFIMEDFYVDDGLTSCSDQQSALSLMKRTQAELKTCNLRLHKIASNSKEMMQHFPKEDLQSDLKSLDFNKESLPVSQTLGQSWDLNSDQFRFIVDLGEKPVTRRGLLSTVHSIFDPMGFVAPLIIRGKMIMRKIEKYTDWDQPLDKEITTEWKLWTDNLRLLEDVAIPRMFLKSSLSVAKDPELLLFSDASEKAVSAVAYVRLCEGSDLGFIMGKCKLAPQHGHTIPRLELCAALLAAEIGETVQEALQVSFGCVRYFTDSRVVLGYICNKTRRFYNYVSNRVQRILSLTKPEQWSYIHTQSNPADIGSRGCSSLTQLNKWLQGPEKFVLPTEGDYQIISPDEDQEVRKEINVMKSTTEKEISSVFELFSTWKRLVIALVVIKRAIRRYKIKRQALEISSVKLENCVLKKDVETEILRIVQRQNYQDEIKCLTEGQLINRSSPLKSLDPLLDENGILRVGGRINLSSFPEELKNPIIVPNQSHVALLLVRHYHEMCQHQGRLLTESTIRNHGIWIIGCKRLVSKVIYQCVTCKKLRGKIEQQKMANLPVDRVTQCAPFTYVGIDVFGPWNVTARRTRGGVAESKRWATLFTCLYTRAVHIEVIEEMSSSSFINALRRFMALRGNVKEIRSDRGTNFIGAAEELKVNVVSVESGPVSNYLRDAEVTWKFNAPHSSHMGGAWERLIGVARRILDNMLYTSRHKTLTHEVLVTFMAEVCAIMNNRPIAPMSSDPDSPIIMTPSMLINQKIPCSDLSACVDIDPKQMYTKHWKMVQILADMFWRQWRDGYLQTLQLRRKWEDKTRNLKNGDVILLKDNSVSRNMWPMGVVENALESDSDGLVRKVVIRVVRAGKTFRYTRPISEVVLLLN